MGILTELDVRLQEIKDNYGISVVTYSRIDSINEDSKNNYPLVLYKRISHSTEDTRKNKKKVNSKFEFFICDLYYKGDKLSLPEKFDDLYNSVYKLITNIPDYENAPNRLNTFEVLSSSNGEDGWEQHNDDLVIIKITADIVGFICNE